MALVGKAFHKEKGALPVCLSMVAIAKFSDETGKNMSEIGDFAQMGLKDVLKFVACAINEGYRKEKKHDSLTWEEVGDLVESDPEFLNLVTEEITKGMPKVEEGKKSVTPEATVPMQ